jgi:hypothetical protein
MILATRPFARILPWRELLPDHREELRQHTLMAIGIQHIIVGSISFKKAG